MQEFQAWVKEYGGMVKLAKRLDVNPYTVRNWIRRIGYPKVDTMRELVKLSKGKLTFETIIESTRPRGNSNK